MARFIEKVNMQSESNNAMMRTGVYHVGATPTTVSPGAFVIVAGLMDNTTYAASGIKDLNKLKVTYPGAPTTDIGVCVTDPVIVSNGSINGNNYRIGAKTIGLSVPAGDVCTMRVLAMHDQFWLGDTNFASTPTVGQYAILTASSVDLTPAANSSAAGFTVAIDATMTKSQGITANTTAYLCRVVKMIA